MVQNEWNIYYCIYNMNHFIHIMKTMNVFNRFLLCLFNMPYIKYARYEYYICKRQGKFNNINNTDVNLLVVYNQTNCRTLQN